MVYFSDVLWGSVEWTNLCTLYLRHTKAVRRHRSWATWWPGGGGPHRIRLGPHAPRHAAWSNQYMVSMRAKQLDDWSTSFLGRYPNAVVLHLGCGMDTRVFRLHPPETVQWFDVDQPNVIALRRKLYDERDGYRMIGSSVTDEVWLDERPTDRPMLMVAEGLLMYLTEPRCARCCSASRIGSAAASLSSTVSPMGPRLSKVLTKGITKWGIRDACEIEQ